MTETHADHHPVALVVDDDLKRNRLTVFFRLLLAIPHLLWLALWGIAAVFAWIGAWFVALFTKRVRGAATYCAACNNGFQALGADCAKNSGWLIARAAYVDVASPLFNARPVAFVHDEFIAEVDDGPRAAVAAHELARLMVEGAKAFQPHGPQPQ